MGTEAVAFAEQARNDLACFYVLWALAGNLPPPAYGARLLPPTPEGGTAAWRVHAGHYLQMATEKAAKAVLLQTGAVASGRRVGHASWAALTSPLMRARAERQVGLCIPPRVRATLRSIEQCCPSNAGGGPNLEYPWATPGQPGGWTPPCNHVFASLASTHEVTTAANYLRAILQACLPRT